MSICVVFTLLTIASIGYDANATMQYYDKTTNKIYTNSRSKKFVSARHYSAQGLENSIHSKVNDVNGIKFPGLMAEADIASLSSNGTPKLFDTDKQTGTYYASSANGKNRKEDFADALDLNGTSTSSSVDPNDRRWGGRTYALGFGIVNGSRPGTQGGIEYGVYQSRSGSIGKELKWNNKKVINGKSTTSGKLGNVIGRRESVETEPLVGIRMKLTGAIANHFDVIYNIHGTWTNSDGSLHDEFSGPNGHNTYSPAENQGIEPPCNGDNSWLTRSAIDSIRITLVPKLHTITYKDGVDKTNVLVTKTQYGNLSTAPTPKNHANMRFVGWAYEKQGDSTTMSTGGNGIVAGTMKNPTVRVENDTVLVAKYEQYYDTNATITARKRLTGATLKDGEFEFQLKENGNVVSTAKNKADGSVVFPAVTYHTDGTHKYTINEVVGTRDGITYDTDVECVVVVAKDGHTTVKYDSGTATFDNVYTPPLSPKKEVSDATPQIGDNPSDTHLTYTISQEVDVKGKTYYATYDYFRFKDPLDKRLDYVNAKMLMRMKDGQTTDITTSAGKLAYDQSTRVVSYEFDSEWLKNSMPLSGETYLLVIETSLNSNAKQGEKISNSGEVVTPRNKGGFSIVDAAPWSPLKPVKTSDPVSDTVIYAGDTIKYTVSYKNESDDNQNVKISDIVPEHTKYKTNTLIATRTGNGQIVSPSPSTDNAGTDLTATFADVGPNETVKMTFTVVTDKDAEDKTTVTNVASMRVDDGPSIRTNEVHHTIIRRAFMPSTGRVGLIAITIVGLVSVGIGVSIAIRRRI